VSAPFPEPPVETKRAALEARLSRLLEYGRRHGASKSLRSEVSEVRAELQSLEARPDDLPDPDGSNLLPVPEGPWSR
jgi:hypothetical protein